MEAIQLRRHPFVFRLPSPQDRMLREAGKLRRGMVDADRFANLPVQVLDLILSYLPLRDLVRTSILSTSWRYNWVTAPKLVFDKSCCSASSISSMSEALARIIDQVLLLHTGSIEVLKIRHISAIPDIDRWVLHVCRQSIKELVLKVRGPEKYRPPSSLYNCESMVKLILSNCILSPPSSFKGLECLKCLCLERCILKDDAFASLISSCPLLGKLTLTNFDGLQHLKIDAPNLQCVHIRGAFDSITFGCTMARLTDVFIDMEQLLIYSLFAKMEGGFAEFFTKLPSIQRLAIHQWFLRHLTGGLIPESLPFRWKHLNHLFICINFYDPKESSAALCLLNSSPNLVLLETESWEEEYPTDAPSVFADGSKCCCIFRMLRRVKMSCIDGTRAELEFIKLVLANSPVLETMTLIPHPKADVSLKLKDMIRFKRLSPEAEIIIDP